MLQVIFINAAGRAGAALYLPIMFQAGITAFNNFKTIFIQNLPS
jgi:hypothetical protein